MNLPRLVLCGGASIDLDDPLRHGRHVVELTTLGPETNVHIRLFDLARAFNRHLSHRLEDLLEIASVCLCGGLRDQEGPGEVVGRGHHRALAQGLPLCHARSRPRLLEP